MIAFDTPALLVLCLAPFVALAAALARRSRALSGPRLLSLPLDDWGGSPGPDAPLFWKAASSASSLLFAGAWMALAVAASGPTRVDPEAVDYKSELDIVFVMDCSPSMAAMDLEPTRLEAAKALVRSFLRDGDGAAGASVGIVAFGADAALVCPPTPDYAIVLDRLEAVRPGMLGDGTAVGQGLASALRQLSSSGARLKAAVLLSDGEDNVGGIHPMDAAKEFGKRGVRLIVAGLGSRGDAPIEYVDPATDRRVTGTYRSDFDEAALANLAARAGGQYRSAMDSGELSGLLPELKAIGAPEGGAPAPTGGGLRTPVAAPFIRLAMLLAAIAWLIRRLVLGGLA